MIHQKNFRSSTNRFLHSVEHDVNKDKRVVVHSSVIRTIYRIFVLLITCRMKIVIGSDHAGYAAKQVALNWLKSAGYEINDVGTYSEDSTDYPKFAHKVAESIEKEEAELGVLLCGSANGVAMSANKHSDVRAAICWIPEIATLARQHNDANICCLPARFVSEEGLTEILSAFFSASFEGGRHARRVEKIACS